MCACVCHEHGRHTEVEEYQRNQWRVTVGGLEMDTGAETDDLKSTLANKTIILEVGRSRVRLYVSVVTQRQKQPSTHRRSSADVIYDLNLFLTPQANHVLFPFDSSARSLHVFHLSSLIISSSLAGR